MHVQSGERDHLKESAPVISDISYVPVQEKVSTLILQNLTVVLVLKINIDLKVYDLVASIANMIVFGANQPAYVHSCVVVTFSIDDHSR